MRGKFIVVEGLEGAGKTTAIETIKDYFHNKIPKFIVTREPGGTKIGEELRKILKDPAAKTLDKRSELLMMYAARIQLITEIIEPALEQGTWVIADRFELSTYAYQGGGRGISNDILDSLSHFCVGELKPDLTIFLDINPKLGLSRVEERGEKDRIEAEAENFFRLVYESYQKNIKTLSNITILDASKPLSEVQKELKLSLEQFWQSEKVKLALNTKL